MSEEKKTNEPTDIFLWANQIDAVKNDLDVELFLFNKFYTPFEMSFSSELAQQIRALFLYDTISFVNLGLGTGLSVREFEMSEMEENVLLRTELGKIEKASKILNMIQSERSDIVAFNEEEHEFKRMKGIIARYAKKDGSKPFYIVKLLQTAAALKGTVSWEINGGRFDRFKADVGIKIPDDNQVLIVGDDIFIFNQSKFERLFDYDYKRQLLADKKSE